MVNTYSIRHGQDRDVAPPRYRWGAMPMRDHVGPLEEVLGLIPRFEKLPPEELGLGSNPHFDLVVARHRTDQPPAPVGLVSKTYKLIQHREVIERALAWLKSVPGVSDPGRVVLGATANFERMTARFDFGARFSITPDGHQVNLQLLCSNSVDGSSAIRARLGWFRLVCSNGLMIGTTLGRTRLAHQPDADLDRAFAPLQADLQRVIVDREKIARWVDTPVAAERIQVWADGPLFKAWNLLAACRVLSISLTGHDAKLLPSRDEPLPPSQRQLALLDAVPGSPPEAKTVYDVVQAMSWVASRRKDLDEVEARQRQIDALANALIQRRK